MAEAQRKERAAKKYQKEFEGVIGKVTPPEAVPLKGEPRVIPEQMPESDQALSNPPPSSRQPILVGS
jgi:hypothetical protein